MTGALIIDGLRTPFGRHGGALAAVRPDDLAAHTVRALLERTSVPAGEIEDVVLGCANQAGEDNRNVARMAGLLAGLPETVGGVTVNRLCGSGMDAVAYAARAIALGDGDAYVAGGVESMSRAPFVVPKPARAYPTGPVEMADTTLGWRLVNPRMEALGHTDTLGRTAENLAAEHRIARGEQDAFALHSHAKAVAAIDAGRFDAELDRGRRCRGAARRSRSRRTRGRGATPRSPRWPGSGRRSPARGPSRRATRARSTTAPARCSSRRRTTPPRTASRRSPASARPPSRASRRGSWASARCPPPRRRSPAPGLTLADMDLIEVNEAFAAQVLAVLRLWGLDAEDDRLNVNGGAIALGHPLGASGARIVATTAHELRRRGGQLALVSMCIGVGQGIALVLEAA